MRQERGNMGVGKERRREREKGRIIEEDKIKSRHQGVVYIKYQGFPLLELISTWRERQK